MSSHKPEDKTSLESLTRSYAAIRSLLLKFVPPLRVAIEQADLIEVTTPLQDGKEAQLFARLSLARDQVGLKCIRVGEDMSGAHKLAPALAACRRGAHEFAFRQISEQLLADIDQMLEFRFSICRARHLV